jgi:hypothetical protein
MARASPISRKIRKRERASLCRLEDLPDDLHRENAKIPRPEKPVKGDQGETVAGASLRDLFRGSPRSWRES